jgi:NAD(P)-dependent dehydrogenase (short-subunit alcohol dehydrogenase family)
MRGSQLAQRVVITGASSGIGQACAARFSREGATVVNIDRQDGSATAALCGAPFHSIDADIADVNGLLSALADVDAVFEGSAPDVLVCCAAQGQVKHFLDVAPEDVDAVFAVNVRGMVLCCREVARKMLPRRYGSIITIGSTAGAQAWANEPIYCASKGATHALTRSMAIDLAPFGIRVNCVAPGSIDTPGVFASTRENTDLVQHDIDRTPLARWGEPGEIAEVVYFLSRASFMTGEVVTVDGGFLAAGLAHHGQRLDDVRKRFS